jgi:outer membrane usher protein
MTVEAYEALRLRLPDVAPVELDGALYYRFSALNGSISHLREETQSLNLIVPDVHRQKFTLNARGDGFLSHASADPGAYMNYDVIYEQVDSEEAASGLFEFGLFGYGMSANFTQIARHDSTGGEFIRLDSVLVKDFVENHTTLRLGDSITRSGAWSRAGRFAGIQYGSNFTIRPDLVTFPTPAIGGSAALPSSVEIYVNDTRRFVEEVPAGPFTIENLPVITGSGEVTAVVTDVLGRQTVISQPFYTSRSLLKPGLWDYSVEAGALRRNYGTESNDYDTPFLSGTARYGFTDYLTAELHGEVGEDRQALGVSADANLGGGFFASGGLAATHNDGDTGVLAQLGLEYRSDDISITVFGRKLSDDFQPFAEEIGDGIVREDVRLNLNVPLQDWGRVSANFTYQGYNDPDHSDQQIYGLRYDFPRSDYGTFSVSVLHSRSDSEDDTIFSLNYFVPLGLRTSASSGLRVSNDSEEVVATIQHRPSYEGGAGGRLEVGHEETEPEAITRLNAEGYYLSDYGRVSAAVSQVNDVTGVRLGAIGGLAYLGGAIFPARQIAGSFAVAQVGDQEGVDVFYENRYFGKTDSNGQILIPNLRAYETNKISIDPGDLPILAEVQNVHQIVTPGFRQGLLVDFPINTARPVIFTLAYDDGTLVPAGARIRVNDSQGTSPVGEEGQVFLQGVQEGDRLSVQIGEAYCTAALETDIPNEQIPDLGMVVCAREEPL